MKRILIIFCICFVGTMSIYAKFERGVLSGRVENSNRELMSNVFVRILNISDSTYVAGTTTDSVGQYEFRSIKDGGYLLEASMLGYKKQYLPIQFGGEELFTIPLIILIEDMHMLSAVTVTARKKTIEIEAGKTIVDLSSMLSESQGNVFDTMKNIPGILIREDGSVYLFGQNGVNVLIDGKMTYLSGENLVNLLRSMPSSTVSRIELITHPSSRHDASGNSGLINIQTKRIKSEGFSFTVSSNYKQGRYSKGNENFNFSLQKDKLNFFIDYSYNWGRNYLEVVSDRIYPRAEEDPSSELILHMTADRRFLYDSHFVRTRVLYDLSSRINIDLYATYSTMNRTKKEVTNSSFFTINTARDSSMVTSNRLKVSHRNIMAGANLSYTFPDKGKWDVSFDLQRFTPDEDHLQSSMFESLTDHRNEALLSGLMGGNIKINTGQSNISYPLSDKVDVDAGTKLSFVSIHNTALYENYNGGHWSDNLQLSNSFFYDENINAGYVRLKAELSKFSLEGGLRIENTNIEGRQNDLSLKTDSVFREHYTHLFPNIQVNYRLNDNHSLALLYGRRITRPNYRDLNPFIEVNDKYLYERGNTELKAELSDNFELSYILNKVSGISLLYAYRSNPITKGYIVQENNRILVTPMNLSSNYSLGAKIFFNNIKLFDWWTIHLNSTLTYKRFHWMLAKERYINKLLTPMVNIYNQMNLPYGLKAEISGFYNGKMAEGQAQIHALWQVSAGVRKNFMKDRASLQLFVDDIFFSNRVYIDLMGSTRGWYKEKNDNRLFGVVFTYRFKSGSVIKDSNTNTRIEESKRINL